MTPQEAETLYAYVEAACPTQAMTVGNPAAEVDVEPFLVWHEIMPASFTLGECREAVGVIVRRGMSLVDLGDLIGEVRLARGKADRLDAEIREMQSEGRQSPDES
jgi:hypothetical protein